MKEKLFSKITKKQLIGIIALLVILVILAVIIFGGGKRKVDKEFEYNTDIVSLDNTPLPQEPDCSLVEGFVEDTEHSFVKLPFEIKDTTLVVTGIGKYTGRNFEIYDGEDVTDIFTIVVKNNGDKYISYSNINVEYAKNKVCSFVITNIAPGCTAVVFSNSDAVPYADVTDFSVLDKTFVTTDSLTMIEDTVGVDYKDGQFIITNLTGNYLGDVYVKYKHVNKGNVYIGGATFSTRVEDVNPYETYKVDVTNFDLEDSLIVAVESFIPITE